MSKYVGHEKATPADLSWETPQQQEVWLDYVEISGDESDALSRL